MWRGVRIAEFHEDVDVAGGFGEVCEADDVGVVDLVTDLHLGLDALYDVVLELELGVVVTLLLRNLWNGSFTCLSRSTFEMILHAKRSEGLFLSQEMKTWL